MILVPRPCQIPTTISDGSAVFGSDSQRPGAKPNRLRKPFARPEPGL